jgi:hypothetical protein
VGAKQPGEESSDSSEDAPDDLPTELGAARRTKGGDSARTGFYTPSSLKRLVPGEGMLSGVYMVNL